MLGLALEGGGAKGAYHMGVVRSFLEEGYVFDGITGTSIGALNGAVIAQGDFEACYEIWEKIEPTLIFDIDDIPYKKLMNKEIDKETIVKLASKAKRIIKGKGMDTSKIRAIIESIVDEDKLRSSKTDFGLVTFSLSDLKPLELYKEDVPEGKMVEYLLASASLPGFEPRKIEDKYYIDGAFYDNCPTKLLAQKGYQEIIAVRTLSPGIIQTIKDPDIKVTNILPSENLGSIINFDNKLIRRNLQMGYYDGMRYIRGLKGNKYCFYQAPMKEVDLLYVLLAIPEDKIYSLGKIFGVKDMDPKRMLLEKILPKVADLLGLSPTATYGDILIALLEALAEEKAIEKYKIYTFDAFVKSIKEGPTIDQLGVYEENTSLLNKYPKKYKILKTAQEIFNFILHTTRFLESTSNF